MDRTPVTNADFARFVKATGYATVAERPLDLLEPGTQPRAERRHRVFGDVRFHGQRLLE